MNQDRAQDYLARVAARRKTKTGRQGDEHRGWGDAGDQNQHEPTAAEPWKVTLCWTPDQHHGRVSVYSGRAPVWSLWGLLRAGEPVEVVADEFGLTVEQVRVLDVLRCDLDDLAQPDEALAAPPAGLA